MLPLDRGGCTAQSRLETEPWAVAPLGWGGCTAQSSLEDIAWAVLPPTLAVAPLSLFQLTWFGSKLGPNQSELGPNWPLLGL